MSNPINPFLWFDDQARAVADFYVATFPDARLLGGSPMVVSVEVGGLKFSLLNGGPQFKVDPSISFFYNCGTEAEIDRLWDALSREGTVLMPLDAYPFAKKYAWVADKFGVNWQLILPSAPPRQKVFPSLMFTRAVCGRAEEALRFYTSVFKDSSVGTLSRYGAGQAPEREGNLNYGEFSLGGQWFTVMDSAQPHQFGFSEGISLYVRCENQGEIDYFWSRLSEGGSESQCGWLKDRFGVSWQVVPRVLEELMADPARSKRVIDAFMKMKKFDIAGLLKA
jgi:predicted 3-demethylubiquinone-9 3-methyltransferase (glyoxalase superfamily)